jgi:NAD(P)-dependent dehydrogenase (short-subunit alcohol dehydrogenase family)
MTTSGTQTSKVLVVGGSSGIGLAVAELMIADGAHVTIAGRSATRLEAAASYLARPRQLATAVADVSSEEQIERLAASLGPVDHVVVTAADGVGGYAPLADFDVARARAMLEVKLLGAWLVAKHLSPAMPPDGSITFTSGIAAYRPGPGASMIASANSGLEGLARALALELAPVRVNVVSPGWVDTPIWDNIAGEGKAQRFADMAERLPVSRVGLPADVARAIAALIGNSFITGTVLHVDGGQRLV